MSLPFSGKIHILVVDDQEPILTMVKEKLKEMGHVGEVTTAMDGAEAIKILKQLKSEGKLIDFIISDVNMPEVTGVQLLETVRYELNLKNVPFLIMSTESERSIVLDAIVKGVSNYLIKPFSTKEIQEKMVLCWEKHHPGK